MRTISVSDIEYLAVRLAKEHLSLHEPIPDFSTRFPNLLESCVLTPFQTFAGKSLYPSLVAKASNLFYLMIKNPPFQNGNNRIALTTLLVFLQFNGKWLRVDTQELYNFTVWVAQSPSVLKDQVIAAIQAFIRKQLVNAN